MNYDSCFIVSTPWLGGGDFWKFSIKGGGDRGTSLIGGGAEDFDEFCNNLTEIFEN